MKQRTLNGCGLDSLVDVKSDGLVELNDGSWIPEDQAYYDCRDNPFYDESERDDSDVEIVTEILMSVDKWVEEYHTENMDSAEGYSHIVDETSHQWFDYVQEWVDSLDEEIFESICERIDDLPEGGDLYEYANNLYDDKWNKELIVNHIVENLSSYDCDTEYHPNEYASYSGRGCCLCSFDIGEVEEQTALIAFNELQILYDDQRLDDVLDSVNCDAYVYRTKRRVKNETTGYYEDVGRPTIGKDDYITTIHSPGGQWMFVVSEERMTELLCDAIDDLILEK